MKLKNKIIAVMAPLALLITAVSMPSVALNAPYIDDIDAAEAERRLMKGCLENEKNDPEQCECAINGMRSEMDPKDHKLMFDFLALTMNGNFSGIWDFIVENKMTMKELEDFGDRVEAASERIEEKCDDVDFDLKLDLGNRKSV